MAPKSEAISSRLASDSTRKARRRRVVVFLFFEPKNGIIFFQVIATNFPSYKRGEHVACFQMNFGKRADTWMKRLGLVENPNGCIGWRDVVP